MIPLPCIHRAALFTGAVLFPLFAITIFGIRLHALQDDSPWLKAREPRAWHFPRDHGAHPDYQTEWWYCSGNLHDTAGRTYGYQLTFFRFGVRHDVDPQGNPWHLRDIYMAHCAITDVEGKMFRFGERITRAGPGLAGARTDTMEIWLFNWSARMVDTAIMLEAYDAGMELKLTLTPVKPIILHGDRGLSQKGAATGQASYYASLTRLETKGTLKAGPGKAPVSVSGMSWFDHEFGSNQLAPHQEGWDWFSLHLSDGRDLMLYILRRRGGDIEAASSGTLVEADGTWRHLSLPDFTVRVLNWWDSPQSGARYPGQWEILIPSARMQLLINPLIPNQELITTASTGIAYWEGTLSGEGRSGDEKVSVQGYGELTGYAGSMGALF